jgi:hypothetical protein
VDDLFLSSDRQRGRRMSLQAIKKTNSAAAGHFSNLVSYKNVEQPDFNRVISVGSAR